jgi:LruC domain-containing protein
VGNFSIRVEDGDNPDYAFIPNSDTPIQAAGDGSVIRFFDNANLDVFGTETTLINTIPGKNTFQPSDVRGTVYFKEEALKITDLGNLPYDIFIIQDNGIQEIHLPDIPPSGLNEAEQLLGTADDDSDSSIGRYYKTERNLPWGLHIPVSWKHPKETEQIIWAYTHFADWTASNGTQYLDWYLDTEDNCNYEYIYSSSY